MQKSLFTFIITKREIRVLILNSNPKKERTVFVMKKYRCIVCGYVYDPVDGDEDGGIAPSTPFEEIPDDWVCPICSAGKEDFEVIDE